MAQVSREVLLCLSMATSDHRTASLGQTEKAITFFRSEIKLCPPTVCGFISGWSLFSVYMMSEWNVIPERGFHSDWKPEWTHSGITCTERNFVPVSCRQIQWHLWEWNELVLEWKSLRYHVNSPQEPAWQVFRKMCQLEQRKVRFICAILDGNTVRFLVTADNTVLFSLKFLN